MSDAFMDKVLGGFRIKSKLGEGGMGAVYLAEQLSLERDVALKVLPASLGENPEYVERFLREARLAAKISHPNVVQVFETGRSGETYFLAMELVQGLSFADLLKQEGPPTERRALSLLRQAALGLGAAAKISLIHRDIKPANLLLTRDGVVKVADFGLAKNTGSTSMLTHSGQVMGTPAYMSPEQGQALAVDHRTDIYSLGSTLFHMLTGRLPFAGDTPVAILLQHVQAPLPDPRGFRPEMSEAVSGLIQAMMAKKPDDRPSSYEDLVTRMDGILTAPAPSPTASQSTETPRTTPALEAHRASNVFCVYCGAPQTLPPGTETSRHFCTQCGKTMPVSTASLDAVPSSSARRRFFCVFCGKDQHVDIGDGRRAYFCKECGKSNAITDSLVQASSKLDAAQTRDAFCVKCGAKNRLPLPVQGKQFSCSACGQWSPVV